MSSAVSRELPAVSARAAWLSRTRGAAPALVVGLITVAAFALRLTQMHQSLLGDEVLAYHEIAGHSLLGTIRVVRAGVESSPPLFFVLAWFSAKLGDPTVWIRLPSLILGTATIPIVYLLGRETVGRRGGVIGAAILAAGPFSTYYGVEARPYATLAFFVALSTFALVRAVRTGRPGWWSLYAVAAAAAAYTHYTAVFVLTAQAAWSLWICRHRLREPVLAGVLAAALYAPWLPQLHGSALGVYALLEPLTVHNVLNDLPHPIVGYSYASLHAIPTIPGLVLITSCALAGLAAIAAGHRAEFAAFRRAPLSALHRTGPSSQAAAVGLMVLLALATPVGLLLYSVLGTDIWSARGLYGSLPAASVVLGGLLAAIPGRLRIAAAVLVLGTLIFGTLRAISPRYARPQFRAAAHYLDRVARPGNPIILYPSFLYLTQAIPAQLRRPHLIINGVPAQWPRSPRGGDAYVVLDDSIVRALKIPIPRPPGFELVAARHYTGLVHFTLLTYRASGT